MKARKIFRVYPLYGAPSTDFENESEALIKAEELSAKGTAIVREMLIWEVCGREEHKTIHLWNFFRDGCITKNTKIVQSPTRL